MRRADRLVQILIKLKGRRLTTAQQLAEWFEVSPRTIYRDMLALMMSGAPVSGEAGSGYWLETGFAPPPMSFSAEELAALEVGARILSAWADPATASAAGSALEKIHGILGSVGLAAAPLYAPHVRCYPVAQLTPLRLAIQQRQCLRLRYEDLTGQETLRVIAPLGLFFWGNRWTLAAWCFLRADYRHFRTDRILEMPDLAVAKTDAGLPAWPDDISLDAFLAQSEAGDEARSMVQQQSSRFWHQE